jgi:hypothetical protein
VKNSGNSGISGIAIKHLNFATIAILLAFNRSKSNVSLNIYETIIKITVIEEYEEQGINECCKIYNPQTKW